MVRSVDYTLIIKVSNISYHKRNYDFLIDYQPGKANVLVDAPSRNVVCKLRAMFTRICIYNDGSLLEELEVKLVLFDQIRTP
ncbi:integrase [Gossypium australe]|uniref:Integrase n=1 Tax=Gossypium australe TaxID=47621 RepID=A0A5B6X1L9_9ROSI|nr:integrase [Gossypium australe]